VARELAAGHLPEWRGKGLRRHRAWHLVRRAGESLPATAALFVDHLVAADIPAARRFRAA
jgi:hypothetical protein